ncbi:MAG: hypothetical protein V4547_20130 [Bacteroidota bacterium]
MLQTIFQIYGALILTMAGFVIPILAIGISFFPDGVKLLEETYENQQKQAENNLKNELTKQKKGRVNIEALSKNIVLLKKEKNKARKKLHYLNPKNIVFSGAFSLTGALISFSVGVAMYPQHASVLVALFLLSLILVVYVLVVFWNSIQIIIEASTAVQDRKRTSEDKIFELLTAIVENTAQSGSKSMFIKESEVGIKFDGQVISPEKEFIFSANKEHSIKIAVVNYSDYLLKTVEWGLILKPEFLVEETSNITSLFTDEAQKIIRFKHNIIQAKSDIQEGVLKVTFLKTGSFNCQVFVKGENYKNKKVSFKIKVIE